MLPSLRQQQIPSQITTLLAAHTGSNNIPAISDKDEAARMMELLQSELDRVRAEKDVQHRATCLKLMRQLNRLHGVLPPSMFLKDLVCEGKTPVTGEGFADIWTGRWNERRVCIKVLRFFQQGSNREELKKALGKEVLLWRQLNHPNILPFLGINTQLFDPTFCMVSPWMSNGDIVSYSQKSSLNLTTKVKHMIQIAEGLVYLHALDPPVVHGDLKGANILISDDRQCCLADFGLSVLDTQSMNLTQTSTVQGSLRWLAPEFISPLPESSQTSLTPRDIYAFGCTVFELLTEKPPFSHHVQDISVAIDVLKGIRPVLPTEIIPNETIFKAFQTILSWCWSEHSNLRPEGQKVLHLLKDVYGILLGSPGASLNLWSLLPSLGPSLGGKDASGPDVPNSKPLSEISKTDVANSDPLSELDSVDSKYDHVFQPHLPTSFTSAFAAARPPQPIRSDLKAYKGFPPVPPRSQVPIEYNADNFVQVNDTNVSRHSRQYSLSRTSEGEHPIQKSGSRDGVEYSVDLEEGEDEDVFYDARDTLDNPSTELYSMSLSSDWSVAPDPTVGAPISQQQSYLKPSTVSSDLRHTVNGMGIGNKDSEHGAKLQGTSFFKGAYEFSITGANFIDGNYITTSESDSNYMLSPGPFSGMGRRASESFGRVELQGSSWTAPQGGLRWDDAILRNAWEEYRRRQVMLSV
ncbi:hypothetical protein GYMLUDRAFT_38419 [Collybiopsis luxurians FD-317 M1]|nr:hypothetical protein GYMLUDRAFT_38419 [Collybiopsis luxurians FD-317 M1]